MRILFDTNVVLDVLLARDPWVAEARVLWAAVEDSQLDGYLAATTITDVFYLARKGPAGPAKGLSAVKDCLDTFDLCVVDRSILAAALSMTSTDFEDNVLIACAQTSGLDGIVSRDKDGFAAAGIPVFTPAELIASLQP